jgi:hypothetical protein
MWLKIAAPPSLESGERRSANIMKTIKLIGGPCNNKEIKDIGTVLIKISIDKPAYKVGAISGEAIYEPSPDRKLAFWLDNEWVGLLL